MIQERYTGNFFLRTVASAVGVGYLFREYDAPEILDHTIEQPLGISVHLKGPKNNLTVICETPQGSFPFSQVLPPRTRFKLDEDPWNSYRSNAQKKIISLPVNTRKLNQFVVYGLLHEGGHLWQLSDETWYEQCEEAHKTLSDQLFSRAIDSMIWLPDDPKERKQHLAAWKISGEEEQNATAIAIYIVGLLRQANIDLLPQFQTDASLAQHVNIGLKSHEVFDIPLTFTERDVAGFLNGNLEIQSLASLIRKRIYTFTSEFRKNSESR